MIEHASWKDLGWKLSDVKKEMAFGILLGIALSLLVSVEAVFSGKLSISIDAQSAAMLLAGSLGVASWLEENICRGHLQPKLAAVIGMWEANITQAILFSIAHIGYWQFASAS